MAVSTETANDLMIAFTDTVSAGFNALHGPVSGAFSAMIALVVALTGIQWALSSNREVLATGFGKILLIGFFAYLINDWRQLADTIQVGFIQLGLTAGGGTLSQADFLNPGEILRQGWQIVKALGETPAPINAPLDVIGNLTDAMILALAMIGVMLAFAVLALQIIVTILEFKIVTLGGFVLLPFGIWSKSAFLAERPLGFVMSSGLKVLALAIVVSGARSVFDQLQPSANPDLYEALAILAASILLAMLAIFIPNLAAALVTGGPALGAGAAATGAMAVGGGAALAAAGVSGLGAAAARVAVASRTAAGAGLGRPPAPPSGSPPRPPGPSNDNPPSWGPQPSPARPASPLNEASSSRNGPGSPPGADGRPGTRGDARQNPDAISAGAEDARQGDVRADAGGAATLAPRQRRNAALQAFFAANAGRSLLPGSETSGALSPQLKTEEP